MSSDAPPPQRKLPLVKLSIVGVVLLVGAVLVLRGVDVRAMAEQGMDMIRAAGPAAFFIAMATLPAFGMPMIAFTVPAGEAFAKQLGMPTVIALAMLAIGINLAFGYWVARYALRPALLGVLKRYGYSVPRVTPENALSVTLLVRLTPGPPYALQGWILGCAEVPFRMYMIVAWLGIMPYAIAGIVLGKGMFEGNFKAVLGGLMLLVAAGVGVHWFRKKYLGKRESRT
jgi:uncharacterized membrane protein YdjX (TVP38/TMEM64 family)